MSEQQEYVTVERYLRMVAHVKELTARVNALVTRMEYIDTQWDTIQGVDEAMRRGESFHFKKAREKRDLARAYTKAEKREADE